MTIVGSRIIVVGGSSGIGRGVATAALERGRRSWWWNARATGSPRLRAIAADVTREDEVARLFGDVGAFDHLVVTRGVPPVSAPVAGFDLGQVRAFVDSFLPTPYKREREEERNARVRQCPPARVYSLPGPPRPPEFEGVSRGSGELA